MSKECIAMLLAGGQGSRLGALTSNIAKPAVSFGGKYRIIDFSLSNCVNSGIDTVGILVQYRPTILNQYLGTGESWDLDNSDGGVHVLPPYATQEGGSWYEGTADSIYHNIDFIDSYNPEYVLILSGDHIYRMDYSLMLDAHKKNKADLTVSVMPVPWEEASRFGIMSTNEKGRITKFAEKPAKPESNLASMGIYIFTWATLKKALLEDHENKDSEKDFGKNIIPKLLKEKKRLFSFKFEGYWKDVGTIDSYYESQMGLLDDEPEFDIYDKKLRIFSNSNIFPPHFIGTEGEVKDSLICSGSTINGKVTHSIIGSACKIGEGAVIKDSIILPGAVIGKGCKLTRVIVNENTVIEENTKAGKAKGSITVL
ncbi:MAG: glucose-1-phosphate adenylyltransferase [Clostridia bacterium]|nr:glucose-1-phosphate adenylyltransferase [Clostridia bacterium]